MKRQRDAQQQDERESLLLQCSMCPPSSQKRYRGERGIRMHLTSVHPLPDGTPKQEVEAFVHKVVNELISNANPSQIFKKEKRSDPDWVVSSRNGDTATLKRLLEDRQWTWDTTDRHGATAEQWCAGSNQIETLKFCISERFKTCKEHMALIPFVNDTSRDSEIAFDEAKCTCEKALVSRKDGRNALHWASRNGHMEIVDFLLTRCKFNVNAGTFDGTTAIMYAVFGCNLALAKQLVEYGAHALSTSNWDCDLVHWLAIGDSSDTTKVHALCDWLFDDMRLCFANVQKEGRTPMHKAAFKNNLAFISWYLGEDFMSGNLHFKLSIDQMKQCFKPDLSMNRPSDLASRAGYSSLARVLHKVQSMLDM